MTQTPTKTGRGFWVRLLERIAGSPPPMCCPFCNTPMTPRRTDSELHLDPTGNGVYECHSIDCVTKPRYRRVDIAWESDKRMSETIRNEIQQNYYVLAEDAKEITKYIRASPTWSHWLGSFKRQHELVIHCLRIGEESVSAIDHIRKEGK